MVSSSWNADFYFYTAITEENSLVAASSIAYYNELQPKQIFNYYYSDMLTVNTSENATTKRKYVMKVNIFAGVGNFGIRRCKKVENGDDYSTCNLNSTD